MIALRRRLVAQVATFAAVLATACLDDRPVEPNDTATGPTVRLGLNATINNAQAGQTVRIRAFYRRKNETDVTLPSSPTSVDVTPGVPKTVAVVVRIADCLADPQQLGGSSTQCAVGITLTLLDEDGTPIDEQTTPPTPPLPPGSSTTLTEIVFAPVTSVAFDAVPVFRVGDVRTLIAKALDAQGRAMTTRKIKWSSDSPNILTIDATTGSVTAVAVGSAKVTATAGTRSATATVKVIRRVASVALSPNPAPPLIAANSLTLVLSAKAADGTDAGDIGDRDVAWSVVNPDGPKRTANVSTSGTVTGVYPGNADVTVSVDGVTKTLRVVVTAAGLRIQAPAVVYAGTKASLTATVVDAKNAPLANVPVQWSTANPSVATIDANGVLTAVAAGATQVTATAGASSATATVRVIRRVSSIVMSPDPASVVVARTLQLVAVPKAADGSDAGDLADRAISWSVANTAGTTRATVSATGLVTGVYPGNADVTVSIDGVTKTLRVLVTAAGLSIVSPSVVYVGANASLTATAVDANGAVLPNVPVAWSSSNPGVATIDANGVLTAVAVGSTQVTATAGTSRATATVRVINRVATIVMSPDPASVVAARSLQLVAVPKAADGSDAGDLADRKISWSVANATPSRASVSGTGLVTGLYPGNADVTVSIDGVTKTLRVVVTAASLRIDSPTSFTAPGTSVQLTAVVLDANGATLANVPVTWTTSNPNVATVDANGVLTATAEGFVTITASGGGVSGTTTMHVAFVTSQSVMSGTSPRN
ncbi:MAG TPA: Ig-like domain-containing protein [Gemmatimonadaceae bacterium]|jgi:uncharacterized protein YjdB